MDIKVPNVTTRIMTEALEQARKARLYILDKMNADDLGRRAASCRSMLRASSPSDPDRQDPRADRTGRQDDPQHRRADRLQDRRRGRWHGEHLRFRRRGRRNAPCRWSADIAAVAEVGKTYLGKVVRIVDFGAFVEIFPGTDGLLHISEISENRIKNVRDELNEGDQILVKVLALEGNKIKLSRKAVLKEQREKLKVGADKSE